MNTCKLILIDEVNCKFEGLPIHVRNEMVKAVAYVLPYAKFTPAGRMGRWDGKVNFMNMGGSTHFHMLDKLLPILEKHDISIEVEDHRIQHNFEFDEIDENIFSYVEFGAGHHMEGQSIVLREHQVNAVNECLKNNHGLLLASTSSGKAQPLDEPVLTKDGWKRMGDICVNDMVKCPDGTYSSVLGVFPQGKKKTVRVQFEDGRWTECCDEHLWDVYSIGFSTDLSNRWKTMSTVDIMNRMKTMKRPIYIPTIHSVLDDDVELPIHPYVLGILIGDGHLNSNVISFSTSDDYIVQKMTELVPDDYEVRYISAYDYNIVMKPEVLSRFKKLPNNERKNPLRIVLENLGLYGKLSYDKFIPEIYKNASLNQKLELIQGLIDSDGYCAKNKNSIEFYSTSEKLIDDFKDILNSIGGIGKKRPKQTSFTYNNEHKKGRPSYVLTVIYSDIQKCASLPRKSERLQERSIGRVPNKLKISSIEYIEDKECQCIYIDHPEHLYITRDYIVTHNTLITAALSKSVEKYGRSIIIVPSTDLVQQTYNDYEMVGLDAGVFYGDKKELGHQHTITTWQSLNSLWKQTKKGEIEMTEQDVYDFIDGVVCVMVDEAHTSAAEALQTVLGQVMKDIPLRWGLTGTIPKDPVVAAKIRCNVGDIIYTITAKELQDKKILSTCNVNCIKLKSTLKFATYPEEMKFLVTDKERMKYIASLIGAIAESGNTLVLVDRLEAGELLCEYLGIPKSEFVRGQTKKKDREASYGEIRWADNRILIATYGVASTGISISRLYNVVLIEPGKSFVRTIQSIGRGLRRAEDKDHVEIYDISGSNKYSAKHSRERIAYYKEVEYPYTKIDVKDWQNLG